MFEKGMQKIGGRAKGVKNKLSHKFLTDLLADYEAHGAEAIKICRIEEPVRYVQMIAALLPKELEISETHLMQIPDDELDTFIEFARRRIAERALCIGVRTDETAH